MFRCLGYLFDSYSGQSDVHLSACFLLEASATVDKRRQKIFTSVGSSAHCCFGTPSASADIIGVWECLQEVRSIHSDFIVITCRRESLSVYQIVRIIRILEYVAFSATGM